jgi:metal-responsive CopG/Arc/MetJ family transcriptional regulator
MRTIVDIPAERLEHLDRWATAQKISRAEAIRRAVNDLLARAASPKNTGFGIWSQALTPERDGLAMQQSMREEWPQ